MSERFRFYFIFSAAVMTGSFFVCIFAVGTTIWWWISNIWWDVLLTILGLNLVVVAFGGWDYMDESSFFQLPIGLGLVVSLIVALVYQGIRMQFGG